jgi:sugar lactone lactonase YvrE
VIAFRCERDWGARPPEWEHGEVPGVAVDAADRVYLLVRADPPVRVYDPDGTPLAAWGSGLFARPHGISIGPSGAVYCVDDAGHVVHRFSPTGELEATLARAGAGKEYDPLAGPGRLEPVARVVSDGYGNARVHVFTSAGELTSSWGEPGAEPGQFHLPHGLGCDAAGRLYVADRLNSRVQRFERDGAFLGEWPARRPNAVAFDADGLAYVAELGGVYIFTEEPDRDAERARVSIRSTDGAVVDEITAAEDGDDAIYFAPHAVAVDRHGAVYVGEVPASYSRGHAPAHAAVVRKYVRVR